MKEPSRTPILPSKNLFPVWPVGRAIQPLFIIPPIDSEYLLSDTAKDWTATIVVGDYDSTLYIFNEGQWFKFPKIIGDCEFPSEHISEVVYNLSVKAGELYEALQGIIEIGKRNTENQKYDGYYERARQVLAKYKT